MLKKITVYVIIILFFEINIISNICIGITNSNIIMDVYKENDKTSFSMNSLSDTKHEVADSISGMTDTPFFGISVLFNQSNTQTAWGMTSADFNNDGKIDFALAYADSPFTHSTISIFYNNGNGNFTKKDIFIFSYGYIDCLSSGDYNHDGNIDLIYSYSEYNQNYFYIYGVIRILFNDGEGHFGNDTLIVKVGTGTPKDPENRLHPHITSADYDQDGNLDFIVGDNSGTVELYDNNGSGNFSSAGIIYDYGQDGERGLTWGVTSGDFNGDGDIDFLVAARVRDNLGHIYFKQNMMKESNGTTIFEPGQGIIIADITTDIRGTASLTSLDYNGDGKMDFIAGIGNEVYLYINKGNEIFERFYVCMLENRGGYTEDLTAGGMASADYNNDGYTDVAVGGVQGFVRQFINNHVLAVITRPKDTYWYLFDKEQYQLFRYTGILCIGKITIDVSELNQLNKIEFYIDGKLRFTDSSPPYVYSLGVTSILRVKHIIKIVAYDGKQSSSEDIKMWKIF